MTHAELLRKHAIEAKNEGGIWFSGAYMDMMATMAESIEAENAKLRELLHDARNELKKAEDELGRDLMNSATVLLGVRMRELGIKVVD